MRLHPNAKLTPAGRQALVRQVLDQGRAVREVAAGAQVSRQTLYKWIRRFRSEGIAGLQDRSSRPRRIPVRTPRQALRRMEQLRQRRKAGWEIAQELGIPVSTVSLSRDTSSCALRGHLLLRTSLLILPSSGPADGGPPPGGRTAFIPGRGSPPPPDRARGADSSAR